MDEIDAFALDQPRQPLDIEAHHHRIFRMGCHLDMGGARLDQFLDHASAPACHDGAAARRDDRARHVDGGALGAARFKRGHDLQYRGPRLECREGVGQETESLLDGAKQLDASDNDRHGHAPQACPPAP